MPGQDDKCVLEALSLTAYHDGMQDEDPAQIVRYLESFAQRMGYDAVNGYSTAES